MFSDIDFGVILRNIPALADGLLLTTELTVLSVVGGLLLGMVLVVLRLAGNRPLEWVVVTYVNGIRSIPLILMIFWLYTMYPRIVGHAVSSFYSVLVAFIIVEGAYYSEIIRAGISGIRKGQIGAGLAVGLSRTQTMRYVILPQAIRSMTPVLLTQAIIMFQDTSLVYVVGLRDLTTTSEIIVGRDGRPTEIYLFVALVFFVICFTASRLVNGLRRRYA